MSAFHKKGSHSEDLLLNENVRKDPEAPFHLIDETRQLLKIAIPTAIVQFCRFAIFPLTAAAIGRHIGSDELAGFSLATLMMDMACLSIIMGVMSAADTLQPRAMAMGRYTEVGLLAIRGYAVCSLVLLVPMIVSVTLWEPILELLGQDPVASHMAYQWARIYIFGIPFVLLFQVLQRFLSAQNTVLPMAVGGVIGTFLFHSPALKMSVNIGGFLGSAVAVVLTQSVHVFLSLWYVYWKKSYYMKTWPGLSGKTVQRALQPLKMFRFLKLGLCGVLSFTVRLHWHLLCLLAISSSSSNPSKENNKYSRDTQEWWFSEAVAFTAGKLGVIPLCAHTVAYQVVRFLLVSSSILWSVHPFSHFFN